MNKIRFGFINDISISKKLWLLNIIGVLLPMFLLFVYFSSQIYSEYEKRETLQIDESINRVTKNLNIIFDSASDITYAYLSDKYISNILNDSTYETSYDALVRFHNMDEQIQADVNTYDFVDDITIYHKNKALDFSGHTQYVGEESRGPWFDDFLNSKESQAIRIEYFNSDIEFYYIRKLNAFSYDSKDYVEVRLNKRILEKQLLDESFNEYEAIIYVIDENDKIIITNDFEFNYNENKDMQYISNLKIDDESIVITKDLNEYDHLGNWRIVVAYTNRILLETISEKTTSLVVITILIVAFSSILIQYISSSISSRLKVLDNAMTHSEEDELIILAEDLGKDEIGHTANRYNEMVNNTKKLIEEVNNGRVRANELLSEKSKAYEELETLNEEIREQGSKIHDLIYMDALTGLKNRFAINKEIEDLLEVSVSSDSMAIIFFDIDNFKYINDTFGHGIGDRVLQETGKSLSEIDSENVRIGRFGGDEFILILKSSKLTEDLDSLLNSLKKIFEKSIFIGSNRFYLSISIGITRYPENGNTKEELIKKADQALYLAKERGKNQFVLYDEAINISFKEKINLQRRIKAAAKNKEFYLNYQPYLAAGTEGIKGFEALIRWDSPGFKKVSPYELITNAEEMGIIIEIGEWVIEEACRFIKKVNSNRDNPVSISINISTVQLMYNEFTTRLIEIVKMIGVNPEQIYLEITETVLINSIKKGVALINELKSFGFGISLDDFGTGYSSLSYFKELPVTILKIDKTFVDNIVDDYYNKELIGTIVKIAHSRQVLVTAEGVEEKTQLDYLTAEGVDMIQGYYYSRPLSEEAAIDFLNKFD